jgi:hypothetical protein
VRSEALRWCRARFRDVRAGGIGVSGLWQLGRAGCWRSEAEIILTSGGREQWQLLWVARLLGRLQAVADDSQDDQRDGEARPGSLCRLLAARQQRVVRKVVANDRAAKRVGALNQGVDNAGLVLRGLDGLREQGR